MKTLFLLLTLPLMAQGHITKVDFNVQGFYHPAHGLGRDYAWEDQTSRGEELIKKSLSSYQLVKPADLIFNVQVLLDASNGYPLTRDQFWVDISLVTSNGKLIYRTHRYYENSLPKGVGPVSSRDTSYRTASRIIEDLLAKVDLDGVMGFLEIGKVVSAHHGLITVDHPIPQGARVCIYRPGNTLFNFRTGNLIGSPDVLAAEGVVINKGTTSSEIQLENTFFKIEEGFIIKSCGR